MFAAASVLAAATAALLALGYWLGDQLTARRTGSTHVVYVLFDGRGWVLYAGSTNDVERRYAEHVRGPDPWRARIAGYSVARHARTEAQARRCEARLVRALKVGERLRVGPPIHNQVLFNAASGPATGVWFAAWLALSVLFPGCRWHRPNPRLALHRHPGGPDGRQRVNPQPARERQQETVITSSQNHPSPVGGRSLLDVLADGPFDTPELESPRRPLRGRPRSRLSEDERRARRRDSNARAAKAYRDRKAGR